MILIVYKKDGKQTNGQVRQMDGQMLRFNLSLTTVGRLRLATFLTINQACSSMSAKLMPKFVYGKN